MCITFSEFKIKDIWYHQKNQPFYVKHVCLVQKQSQAWTGRSVLVEADDPISESKDTEEYAPCAGPVLNKCKMKGQTAKKKR